jgi:hypothetical protein
MKRIYPFLLFAVAAISWAAMESGGASNLGRATILGILGVLTLWKAVDFWKRNRDLDEAPVDDSEPGVADDRTR